MTSPASALNDRPPTDHASALTYIVQLSDTHAVAADRVPGTDPDLFVDNNARLELAIDAIGAERPTPAVVLATGDLANDGRPEEYATLAAALGRLSVPVLPLPGNHDERRLLREVVPGVPWVDGSHLSWEVTVAHGAGSIRLIGLDTTEPGRPGALFDDERHAWLSEVLGRGHAGPTILAMHHPPFATGIGWMDAGGFTGLDRLAATVRDAAIDRIVCGHMHRPIVGSCGGVIAQVAPSTVQAVSLGLDAATEVSLVVDPAGYLVHRIAGDEIATHVRYLETVVDLAPIRPHWAGFYE